MRKALSIFLVLFSTSVWAVPSTCQNGNFEKNELPIEIKYDQEICHDGFNVLYSEQARNPAVVAEYLTPQRLQQGFHVPRKNDFHEDEKLAGEFSQAELSDYDGSGYDRGHQAPAADAFDTESKHQTFVMTNMVPQTPNLNRCTWRMIEEQVRNTVLSGVNAYVLTGPIYQNPIKTIGKNQVWIPAYSFKAVEYSNGTTMIYVAENSKEIPKLQVFNEKDFSTKFGFDPFKRG